MAWQQKLSWIWHAFESAESNDLCQLTKVIGSTCAIFSCFELNFNFVFAFAFEMFDIRTAFKGIA